jgi:hypothetical protein
VNKGRKTEEKGREKFVLGRFSKLVKLIFQASNEIRKNRRILGSL